MPGSDMRSIARSARHDLSVGKDERDAGFTLVEVIAALTILSVALTVLFSSLSGGFYHQQRAMNLAEASSIAQSLLAQAGTDLPLKSGETNRVSEHGYRWILEVIRHGTPTEQNAWPVTAYKISVKVFKEGAPGNPTVTLSTIRLTEKQPRK